MRILLVLTLLLAPALAGCATPSASTPDAGGAPAVVDEAGNRTLPWGLTDCHYIVGWTGVDPAALKPYLPEGFTPGTGFLPLPVRDGRAIFGMETFRCASGAGLNGTVEDMIYGSFWTVATPPKGLEREGVDFYTVRWDTLVPDDDRRALLQAEGLPVHAGTVDLRPTPGDMGAWQATYTMEGIGAVTLQGVAHRNIPPGGDEAFIEFTPTPKGLAEWHGTIVPGQRYGGEGTGSVPAGSWAAKVIGAERFPIMLTAGRWTFTNASLVLPPAAG